MGGPRGSAGKFRIIRHWAWAWAWGRGRGRGDGPGVVDERIWELAGGIFVTGRQVEQR